MHTHKQLLSLVQAGIFPQITFTKACEELESYCEPGMKAIVRSAVQREADLLVIEVDYVPFEAVNKPLETANYYGAEGVANLTARQAGYYKPQESIYLDFSGLNPAVLTIDGQDKVVLYGRYTAETNGAVSYVSWLEDQVLRTTQV